MPALTVSGFWPKLRFGFFGRKFYRGILAKIFGRVSALLGLVRKRRFSVAYLPRILLSGLVRKFATLRNPMDKVEHF